MLRKIDLNHNLDATGDSISRPAGAIKNRRMVTPKSNLSRFSRYLWLTLGMFVVFVTTFILYVRAEKQIDRANESRQQSFRLADELRQSSDDLTRMVRTYVVTGDPIYKQHYHEILDIRDGKKPRPVDYQNSYWDLVLGDDKRPRPPGPVVPLLDLMRQAGFTEEEFAKLEEAKGKSDALTHSELAAMDLIESSNPPTEPNRAAAIRMLHDTGYHQAKAGIMRPITQFQNMADQRTLEAVRTTEAAATQMRYAFMIFGLLLVSLLWRLRGSLHAVLGSSVNELYTRIARLGSGDFSCAIPVAEGMENSILGWLSQTQINLARLDVQRKDAEARSQRVTQLYAARSQCNQAIVRCTSEAELFAEVCRIVVNFGGMKMAWIGALDEQGKKVRPVASFGAGTEYLKGMEISLDVERPQGRGPTGLAFRDNVPFWCQDFLHDATTEPWHERAARFGWAASAAIPLHRNGVVVEVFNLYAGVANAFDEEVRNLLTDMAMDIDYSLKNFEQEAQREQAEATLRESEQRLRTIIETEPECINVVDSRGRLVEMNAVGLAMLEADSRDGAATKSLEFRSS